MQKRQILDNIVLVQDVIHFSRYNKERCMIIKIDMENSFDRVKHSFLFDSMHKFSFIPLVIRQIVLHIKITHFNDDLLSSLQVSQVSHFGHKCRKCHKHHTIILPMSCLERHHKEHLKTPSETG
jgi:hypothetical protein